MRLEKMKYDAYEATWKKDGDIVEVDYLNKRIPFSGSKQLELGNIIGIYKFDVRYSKVVKYHLFREHEYGKHRYLHVLAIEKAGGKWIFLCDSKKIFCSLADEFSSAFDYIHIESDGKDGKIKKHGGGYKEYNASHFYKKAIKKEGARLEFLYYLLDQGQWNCGGVVQGCAFKVPEEKWEGEWIQRIFTSLDGSGPCDELLEGEYHGRARYPSHTEECVILDGENFEELYQKLLLLLSPHKIGLEQGIDRVKAEYGDGFIHKKEVLKEFRRLAGSVDLPAQIQDIREEISHWTDWINDNQVETGFGHEYLAILSQKIDILEKKKEDFEKAEIEEQKRKNSDNSGEKAVEYEISWFSVAEKGQIISISADCESKYRYNCILLAKQDFIKENQEYDHIIVGPGGVLLIETKHWKGAVEIRSDGKWIRSIGEENRKVGVENPKSQIWRHETLIKAIVPGIAVSSILCFSNADIVIDGKEYFTDYPVIYVDQLRDCLSIFCGNKLYSETEVRSIAGIIESHKVHRMLKQ